MKPNKLHDKYYNGTSTLEEEKQLRKQSEDLLLRALENYEKPDFSSIEQKISDKSKAKSKSRKLIITIGTAAAMLIAFLSVPLYDHYQNKIAERKVEALFSSEESLAIVEKSHQMISKLTHVSNFIEFENKQFSISTPNAKFSIPTLSRLEYKN